MAWYDDIEEEIIVREAWGDRRTNLEPFEALVQKAEIKVLTDDRWKKHSTSHRIIKHRYYTESGLLGTLDEDIIVQELDYIYGFIHKEIWNSTRVSMTQADVRHLLDKVISDVYISADLKDVPVRVEIQKTQRRRRLA